MMLSMIKVQVKKLSFLRQARLYLVNPIKTFFGSLASVTTGRMSESITLFYVGFMKIIIIQEECDFQFRVVESICLQ